MTITLTLRDVLLALVAVAVLVGMFYLIAALRRILAIAEEWRRMTQQIQLLVPQVQRVVEHADETLLSARQLIERSQSLVGDVAAVTGATRSVAEGLIRDLAVILGPIHLIASLFQKIQSGISRWSPFRAADEQSQEDDDEERNL
jgi:uncharacterized protein YoxC